MEEVRAFREEIAALIFIREKEEDNDAFSSSSLGSKV